MTHDRLPRVIFLSSYAPMYPGQKKPSPFIVSQQKSLEALGTVVYPFYTEGRRLIKYPLSIRRLRHFVAETPADVIHAHYSYSGALALCQRRLPIVVSFLGGDVFVSQIAETGNYVLSAITFWITQLTALQVNQVIVKSAAMSQRLWRKEGVHVIPNGVDLTIFSPCAQDEARRALGLNVEGQYVLFPSSRFRPEKNYPLAKMVFEKVRARFPGVELLTLESVPQEQMPLYFNAANVVLFTSKSEGSPNVIKESMACNIPIVTVDVGDTRAVVAKTRHCWVTGYDPDELTQYLTLELEKNERSNGREHILMYDQQVVARRLINVYEQALKSR